MIRHDFLDAFAKKIRTKKAVCTGSCAEMPDRKREQRIEI
jgi:hypothetical protein